MNRFFGKYILLFGLLLGFLLALSACDVGGAICSADDECLTKEFCDLKRHMCFSLEGKCSPKALRKCFSGAKGTLGVGVCKGGEQVCDSEGVWGACVGEQVASTERCDGKDNDCNGKTDEFCAEQGYCATTKPFSKMEIKATLLSGERMELSLRLPFANEKLGWVFVPKITLNPSDWKIEKIILETTVDRRRLSLIAKVPASASIQFQFRLEAELAMFPGEKNRCPFVYTSPVLYPCPKGQKVCDRKCVDLNVNAKHCGTCGNTCPSPRTCKAGTCTCEDGTAFCSGSCVDFRSDSKHCGKCGNACKEGSSCQQGSCQCPNGLNYCDERCIDVKVHMRHCGKCGQNCPAPRRCEAGQCVCAKPLMFCDGKCVGKSDPEHCGKCGNKCTGGKVCSNGNCILHCKRSSECASGELCRTGICIKCPGDARCDRVLLFSSGKDTVIRGHAVDKNDNLYVVGDFGSRVKLSDPPLEAIPIIAVPNLKEDVFLVKVDAKGKSEWLRTVGGRGRESS